MTKKLLQGAVGLVLTIFFVWLILRRLDLHAVATAIGAARPGFLLAALATFLAGYGCRVARWRIMLAAHNGALRWRDCAGPLFASVAANNVLPFRMGDIIRSFGFCKQLGVSQGVSITTLFVERLLDLLMVLLFLAGALAFFPGGELVKWSGLAPILAVAALSLLLIHPALFDYFATLAARLVRRLAPRFGALLTREVHRSVETITHVSSARTMAVLIAWSFLAWACESLVFWLCACALPALDATSGAWLALPVGTLATIIPSAPGFIGTFDFFVAQAMTQSGNTPAAAAAFAVLVHLMLWIPPTVLGGAYLLSHPVRGLMRFVAK